MAVQANKKRILYLMTILNERTDEKHILNAADLCDILKNKYDMETDRRTIYNEIAVLSDYGMDIVQLKGKTPGYYVASRDFELPEVKILVDAVQSSKFITEKKSRELIAKLEKLCSAEDRKELNPQVVITNRPKTTNKTIYYNIDRIHTAIYEDRKIAFQYTEWLAPKKQQYKHGGKRYQISPLWMLPDDDCYYMLGFDAEADKIKHYRIDRMSGIEILEDSREGKENLDTFDVAEFAKRTFNMYGGTDTDVTLRCSNRITSVIMDRFGYDTFMIPDGEGFFRIREKITVSSQFFGWITGLGKAAEIVGPAQVRQKYVEYLRTVLDNYSD